MTTRPRWSPSRLLRYSATAAGAILAGVLTVAMLGAFHVEVHAAPTPAPSVRSGEVPPHLKVGIRTAVLPRNIPVTSNVTYGTSDDGIRLTLDVCSPVPGTGADPTERPGVIAIHGGSWDHGDKAGPDWHAVCVWLASEGFVTFSVDYRLVPAARFPAQIDDVTAALDWIRDPENAKRFGVDPHRVGVLGGSAGANLAALLGMRGSGGTRSGSRVAAVVDLSGPVDLTAAGQRLGHPGAYLQRIELAYLNCHSFEDCPQAKSASPVYDVDPSDPPVFIGQSETELIPAEQGKGFAAALKEAGVPHTLALVPGSLHSIAALDATMRAKVADFLHRYLGR